VLFLQRFFDDPFDALAANEQSIGFGQLLVVRDDLFDAVMPEFSFDVPMRYCLLPRASDCERDVRGSRLRDGCGRADESTAALIRSLPAGKRAPDVPAGTVASGAMSLRRLQLILSNH
jgi:hypothetical protein